jgi:hypothetical protein
MCIFFMSFKAESVTLCVCVCVCLCLFSMSAIDFYCSVDKIKGVDGNNRVVVTLDGKYLSHSEQVSLSFYDAC